MSKSVARVRKALRAAGSTTEVLELPGGVKTAEDAARAMHCPVSAIAKSVIFRAGDPGRAVLFITAGDKRVALGAATALAGDRLERADAGFVRAATGFVIGGVAPIGHLSPPQSFFDPHLLRHAVVYAAAGTPHHLFAVPPRELLRLSGAQPADFTEKDEIM